MKRNDFLKSILAKSFTNAEELEAFLADPAADVPDQAVSVFNFNYLTRERAINDEDILKKVNTSLKAQNFGAIDNRIDKLLLKLSPEDQAIIQAEKNTLTRMDLLNSAIDNMSKGKDTEEVSKTFRKLEHDYKEKIKGLETTITEKDATFEKRIKDNQLDFSLRGLISEIELAPEYQNETLKKSLQNTVIDNLKKKYVLQFDEKDQSTILLRQNVEGLVKEVYEGNNVVTLPDLLKKELDPFIKKSNAGDTTTAAKKVIPSDKPQGGTLIDYRRAQAGV